MKLEDVLQILVNNGFKPFRMRYNKQKNKWYLIPDDKPVMTKYIAANFNVTAPGGCDLIMCKSGYEDVRIGLCEKGKPPQIISGMNTLMQLSNNEV